MKMFKSKKASMMTAVLCVCALTGCGNSAVPPLSAGYQNVTGLVALSNADSETAADSNTAELPDGNVDYSVYEQYGLIYDKESQCYTYNGAVVRFFNDPAAGAGFTNFFTGTVDLEAERDNNNRLIGIKECSAEVYDRHTKKHEKSASVPASKPADTTIQAGNGMENIYSLKDYEAYGITYNKNDGFWYYNNQKICIFIDSGKTAVYFNDEGSIYLSVSQNSEYGAMEITEISKADAQALLENNTPGNSVSFTVEE